MTYTRQNASMTLTAIIFDMDGLMLDSERIAQQAWQQAGAAQGYEIPTEVYLQAVGRTKQDTEATFKQALGQDFPFETLYDHKQQLVDQIIAQGIPTKPGLFELLDLIDQWGLQKAVATSTARPIATKKLSSSGLLGRFETIVCGDEIPNGKPAPDIFLTAAGLLNVPPAQCMVLEDSEAGIQAAHAAGMKPVMVPDLKQPSAEVAALAYSVSSSLLAIPAILQNLKMND